MRRASRGIAVTAALSCAAAAACAGAPRSGATPEPSSGGGREEFVREIQALYPEAEYLVGIGESERSAEAAEARAVTDAAAAIRSHVQRNFRTYEAGVFRGGVGQVDSRVVDEIEQKVETDAGALIRPRHEHTRRLGRAWLAAAVGSRADLDARYAEDGRPLLDRLGRAYDEVLSARGWLAAAPAWCEVPPLEDELERRSMERWAISRRSLWPAELLARSREAHARQRGARASLRVAVLRLAGAPEADPAAPIVAGLRAAGWAAAAAGSASCPAGHLLLAPALQSSCRRSSAGIEVCSVTLQVEGRPCGEASALFAVSREAQATDSRDAERAQRSARRKLPVAALAQEAVARALATLGECRR